MDAASAANKVSIICLFIFWSFSKRNKASRWICYFDFGFFPFFSGGVFSHSETERLTEQYFNRQQNINYFDELKFHQIKILPISKMVEWISLNEKKNHTFFSVVISLLMSIKHEIVYLFSWGHVIGLLTFFIFCNSATICHDEFLLCNKRNKMK